MAKMTKRHFKLFCDEVKRWCDRFGLKEWRLDFVHEALGYSDDGEKILGQLVTSYQNRAARVSFTAESQMEQGKDFEQFVINSAKHEAIELLVDDLATLASCAFKTRDEYMSVRHTLVRRLEAIIK